MAGQARVEGVESFWSIFRPVRPHRLSMTTMRVQTGLIVRIRTSDGIIGHGQYSDRTGPRHYVRR